MKPKYNTLVLLLFLMAASNTLFSQTNYTTNQGQLHAENYMVDWSVGEIMISTAVGDQIYTQGFHQPFVICNPCEDAIQEEENEIELHQLQTNLVEIDLKLFPNPVSEELQIEMLSPIEEQWFVSIYDATGRLIYKDRQQLREGQLLQRKIDVTDYENGQYYLRIFTKQHAESQKFQILK